MQKVAAEKLQAAADTLVGLFVEAKFVKHIEMKMKQGFGLGSRARKIAVGERAGDTEQAVGDALHSGDDHDDVRGLRGGAGQRGGVEHSLGPEQRRAAKLKGDHRLMKWRRHRACAKRVKARRHAATRKKRGGNFFLHGFGTHDFRSWLPRECLWRGVK